MYRQLCTVLIFAASLYASDIWNSDRNIAFRLDGSTVLRYDRIDPSRSHNLFGIIEGDICDRFPISHLGAYGLSPWAQSPDDPRLTAAGAAGSEFGDPLLNKLDDPSLPNRDHFTLLETSLKIPGLPIRLFNGYRYVDHYTDRFDSLWYNYKRQTGREMVYSNRGVAHGISGGFAAISPKIKSIGFLHRYGYWGATPFYFSPIYRRGISYAQTLQASLGDQSFWASVLIDQYERYYDHHESVPYTDRIVSGRISHAITGSIFASLEPAYDSRIDPGLRIAANLGDSVSQLKWMLNGAVYGNGRQESSVGMRWDIFDDIFIEGESSWEYFPAPREFTFYESETPVHYRSDDFDRRTALLRTGYRFGKTIPVDVTGWYRYEEKQPWESIETFAESTVITYETLSDIPRHFGGASVATQLKRGRFIAKIHADGGVNLDDENSRFHLPWRSFVELIYGNMEDEWFYGSIRYEVRSGATLNFFDKNLQETAGMESPSQSSLSFGLMVPFLLPFGRDHLQTRVRISTESIRAFSDSRLRIHPGGNLIGPGVSVTFDGAIR